MWGNVAIAETIDVVHKGVSRSQGVFLKVGTFLTWEQAVGLRNHTFELKRESWTVVLALHFFLKGRGVNFLTVI